MTVFFKLVLTSFVAWILFCNPGQVKAVEHTITSDTYTLKTNFNSEYPRSDTPSINITNHSTFLQKLRSTVRRFTSQKHNPSLVVKNPHGQSILTQQIDNTNTTVTIPPQDLTPGKYQLLVDDQTVADFSWGVLAINLDQAVYQPGEKSQLAIAVLDDRGQMVCDAEVTLQITSPSNITTTLSTTAESLIVNNEVCQSHAFTLQPDYFGAFDVPAESGSYQLDLTAITSNGTHTIHDNLLVESTPQFIIQRTSATRLYPINNYPMTIHVTPLTNYQGLVTEAIPDNFAISQIYPPAATSDIHQITWQVDWQAGQTYELGYTYNPPDDSPALYSLGPLTLSDYLEPRSWQLAIDAPTRLYLSAAAADKTLPSVQGTWTNSSNSLTALLGAKSGSAATQGYTSTTSTSNYMVGRWQTNPLDSDYNFSTSDTVQYVVGAVATSTTNSTWHFRIHIFVIESDGTTVRGTLLNNYTGTGTAFTTTATGRTDSTHALSNNVSAKAGDRIVVELGYNRTGSSTSSRSVTYNYGNTGGTDLTSGNTSVTSRPGWIEFSNAFSTTAGTAPAVTTQAVSSITATTATGNGTVTLDNGFPITERGIVWNTSGTPTTSDSKSTSAGTTGAYTANLTSLSAGTTYYVRAYAINSVGTSYGNEVSFTTNSAPTTPSLDSPSDSATGQSLTPSLLTTTTDTDSDYLRYKITFCEDSGMSVNCQTFDQTSSQTGWSGQDAQTGTAYSSGTQATYTIQSPLSSGTTYYWKSYAIDPAGTNTWSSTQGSPYSFTTLAGGGGGGSDSLQIQGINLNGVNVN